MRKTDAPRAAALLASQRAIPRDPPTTQSRDTSVVRFVP
jgi:hypothetical protein